MAQACGHPAQMKPAAHVRWRTVPATAAGYAGVVGSLQPPPPRLEIVMTQKTQGPAAKPTQGPPAAPRQAKPQNPPTEPVEVLGRHKNSGQKDHKGAR